MKLEEAQDYAFRKLKQLGAVDIVLTATSGHDTQIKFANNDIATTKDWRSNNLSVFVALGERGKIKTAAGSLIIENEDKLLRSIQHLIDFAKRTNVNKDYYAIAEGPFKYKKIRGLYDKRIAELGDKAIDIVHKSIGYALTSGAVRCAGFLDYGVSTTRLLTSNGFDKVDKGTDILLSLRAMASKEASCHKEVIATTLSDFRPKNIMMEAGKWAARAREPKNLPEGKYNVIFDPMALSELLRFVAYATSMADVEVDLSFLKGKLGEAVASKEFTLYDWGNKPHSYYSSPFDDEGHPTQKTALIQKGVLKSYLHNTSTAHRHGTKSTGNAGILFPNATNLIVAPGRKSFDGLVADIKDGLYITNTWYTRFQNYAQGDFSTLPRDAIFRIRNGRLAESVKGIRVLDNLPTMLKNIAALGNAKTVYKAINWEEPQSTETPPILIRKVNISRPM